MTNKLTERQRLILDYIITFKQINDYSPSTTEISKGTYITNHTTILNELTILRANGYINFKDRKTRTITVIKFI